MLGMVILSKVKNVFNLIWESIVEIDYKILGIIEHKKSDVDVNGVY